MIDTLHNNSNRIGVRINNQNNLNFPGTSKIDEHQVDGTTVFTWKTIIDYDFVVNGSTSLLVTAGRANGSPFGGPFAEGESRVVSYSLNGGEDWTVLQDMVQTDIKGTGFLAKASSRNNSAIVGLEFPGNSNLIGDTEIVFKIEMIYEDPAEVHEAYKGPEYIVIVLRGRQKIRGFVDSESGVLFDGNKPYIFWMPGQGQSTAMNYSQTIWAAGTSETITVSMNPNSVFKLIDNEKLADYSSYSSISDMFVDTLEITGQYLNDSYIYPIYIYSMASEPGQYVHPFSIGEEEFFVGCDVYAENENLYINLANMGVELPDSIQKALYTSNIQEEKKDNILINRKLKELISQYWDVLAGRGSYKSLINSLNWFEWGDIIRLREIWARDGVMNNKYFADEELSSLLTNNYKESLSVFRKTTYLSIYAALQKAKLANGDVVYDPDQLVPELEPVVTLWSKEDLSLKLAMLGAFYETFFMPIHLELLHCTIEDIVYTDSFRSIFSGTCQRIDYSYQTREVECNIKDDDTFPLHNCQTYTAWNTLFAWDYPREYSDDKIYDETWGLNGTDQYSAEVLEGYEIQKQSRDYNTAVVVGVESDFYNPQDLMPTNPSGNNIYNSQYDNYQRNYWVQRFAGVGVIVPFEMTLWLPEVDSVFEEKLYVIELDKNNRPLTEVYRESHISIPSETEVDPDTNKYKLPISFQLLFTRDAKWQLRFEFRLTSGENVVKTLIINTVDLSNATIKIMKVCADKTRTVESFSQEEYGIEPPVSDYMMRLQPFDELQTDLSWDSKDEESWVEWTKNYRYNIFIPHSSEESSSIRMSNILIYRITSQYQVSGLVNYMSHFYEVFKKYELKLVNGEWVPQTNSVQYVIGVSREFDFDPTDLINTPGNSMYDCRDNIYRNDYGFINWKHFTKEIGNQKYNNYDAYTYEDTFEDYLISPNETLCVVPDIKYGHEIAAVEWEFKNVSKNKSYFVRSLNGNNISTQSPFVAAEEKLEPGFYDIIFRYRLKSDPTPRELRRNSAFKLLKS